MDGGGGLPPRPHLTEITIDNASFVCVRVFCRQQHSSPLCVRVQKCPNHQPRKHYCSVCVMYHAVCARLLVQFPRSGPASGVASRVVTRGQTCCPSPAHPPASEIPSSNTEAERQDIYFIASFALSISRSSYSTHTMEHELFLKKKKTRKKREK